MESVTPPLLLLASKIWCKDPDRQHAIGRDAQKDTDHEPHGHAQDQ